MQKWIDALTIFAKYTQSDYPFGAEHDQIWVYVTDEQCPTDSDDGVALEELGWWYDDDCGSWSKFV